MAKFPPFFKEAYYTENTLPGSDCPDCREDNLFPAEVVDENNNKAYYVCRRCRQVYATDHVDMGRGTSTHGKRERPCACGSGMPWSTCSGFNGNWSNCG